MGTEEIYTLSETHPIIIYDGVCRLCNFTVQHILKNDNKNIFKFSPIQYISNEAFLTLNKDSVILLENRVLYHKSKAVEHISMLLGGRYKILSFVLKLTPNIIADYIYDIVAKYRYSWFGKYDTCILPDPIWKDKFIE